MGDEGIHDEADAIREQMNETRTALTEKLETLENEVIGTVQEATTAVTETVATVKEAVQETVVTLKDSVQETVHSVKETFNVERQVRRHPWAMLGGAVALGFLGGSLLARGSEPPRRVAYRRPSRPFPPEGFDAGIRPEIRAQPPAPAPERESWLSRMTEQFQPELEKVKGMAIGATLALIRDMVTPSLPPALSPKVSEVINDVASKLGGEPIREPLLSQTPANPYDRRAS